MYTSTSHNESNGLGKFIRRKGRTLQKSILHIVALMVMLVASLPAAPAAVLQATPVVAAVLAINTPILPHATVGVPYSQNLTATGGTPPYVWAITQGVLPTGLSLAPATGVISGTSTGIGAPDFTVQVTDSVNATATRMLSIVLASGTLPGGMLDPTTITKYVTPLIIPPEMPKTSTNATMDYYEIAVRQFQQQILPVGLPPTTVWSYGSLTNNATFNYPAFTIEATQGKTTRVKWINDLINPATGNYLPHLLPIDQTLMWANPPGTPDRDMPGTSNVTYTGPVPLITHVHGAHTSEIFDGHPEAWYLPAANNIPAGYFTTGTAYDVYKIKAAKQGLTWQPGSALFDYPNDQRASTLWYHDHAMGMTRTNVYAGPAGFYLLRGGPDDLNMGFNRPGLSLGVGVNATAPITEIPIAIQDRSFNADGSLFYPDNRAFFEGVTPAQLNIPFIPRTTIGGQPSDVSPIANPEFFGNTMVVNGDTWPYLNVEQRQYRFRILDGTQARYLILKLDNGGTFYQIGSEGGFLPSVVPQTQLLISPAERADVIIDFTNVPVGNNVTMLNIAPDSPFGGGVPGIDFPMADPATTGQVMQFRVVARVGSDNSTPVASLALPALTPVGTPTATIPVSLNEDVSGTVWVTIDGISGNINEVSANTTGAFLFGPIMARLGTFNNTTNISTPLNFSAPITELMALNSTNIFEFHNFTADAHPIHLHLVMFQVINREDALGVVRPPESWETGYKDTVTVYPGEITRVKAKFDMAGLFVWHCHIIEHEDNEMMRPYMTYVPPTVNAGPNANISANTTFAQTGSFDAPGLGPWTATVNYGDGSGIQPLTLTANMTFTLSHLYASAGVYTANVTVTDNLSGSGSSLVTVTVNAALAVVTTSLPNGTVGVAYSQNLSATGGVSPYTWSIAAGALPAGLTANATTGLIAGTPTTAGTATFTVQVTDSLMTTATMPLSITINAAPPPVLAITTTSLPDGTAGVAYSQSLTTTGGVSPYTWSIAAGALPAGLTANATTGLIAGTPTTAGTANFTVQVTDSLMATATMPLSITINAAPPPVLAITTTSLPNGTAGVAYSQSLTATGGVSPYTWSIAAGALPAGLTANATTGLIAGTPTTAGTANFTVQVTDSLMTTATMPLSITINSPASLTISSVLVSNIDYYDATISWNTDSNATSQVFYDTVSHAGVTGYAYQTTENTTLVKEHLISLGSLAEGTRYYFRVKSAISGTGTVTISEEFSFVTTSRCFIATAAYGTATAEEINILRRFRDRVLLHNKIGAAFVAFYYRTSPPIAAFISRHEALRTMVREGFVNPLVSIVKYFWPSGMVTHPTVLPSDIGVNPGIMWR